MGGNERVFHTQRNERGGASIRRLLKNPPVCSSSPSPSREMRKEKKKKKVRTSEA
jgi:hypothetical protein